MDTVSLGNRIRTTRMAMGLTQDDLAAKTGISTKHLSVLERGLKEPRLSTFLELSNALRMTPNEMLASNGDNSFAESLAYKIARIPPEKQEKASRIIDALIEEL